MGLRKTTLAAGAPQIARTSREWAELVQDVANRAAVAVSTGRVQELPELYAEVGAWEDPQRAYQGRRELTELVFTLASANPGQAWTQLYLSAIRGLLDALESDPCEPVLLNHAGVLLYELAELPGAEALFKVAQALDPTLPHVRKNLDELRRLKQTKNRPRLHKALASQAAALGGRAKQIAAKANPVRGLTISLCMIVKDEEEMLPGCLEPVHEHVDELIVVDTGSTDRTVEIAESFGAKVIHFPWNGSFADARNVGLNAATGDWLMYLDADEHMFPEDAPKLRDLLGRTWREGFHLVETNFTGRDESGSAVTHLALRIFRNRPDYRFEGRIHEQKTQKMPTYLPERFEQTPIRMLHYGYLKARVSDREKWKRNIELLEREAAEAPSPFNSFNLGSEYHQLGDFDKAREYFEKSWETLGATWTEAGYATILASRLGTMRRLTGDTAGARAILDEGLAAFPDHTDLVLELALCAWDEGELEQAERLGRRCLEMGDAPAQHVATAGSGTFLALSFLGELERKRGNTAVAEGLYRQSLAEYPEFLSPILPLVDVMLQRDASPDEIAAEIPPDRPLAALLAATALHEAGHNGHAESSFRAVLERQPANGVARVGLVESLLVQRRYDEAADEAARESTDSLVAPLAAGALLFARAVLRDQSGLLQAVEWADEAGVPAHDLDLYRAWHAILASEAVPASLPAAATPTLLTALEALLRVQEFEAFESAVPLVDLLQLDPRERRELLARMYLRRGFLESAADEWIAVAQAAPDARALVGLAQVAYAQGTRDDSIAFLHAALQLEPGNEDAERMLAGVQARAA
jgi:tetratricopeptide (TPR) repeat protein